MKVAKGVQLMNKLLHFETHLRCCLNNMGHDKVCNLPAFVTSNSTIELTSQTRLTGNSSAAGREVKVNAQYTLLSMV